MTTALQTEASAGFPFRKKVAIDGSEAKGHAAGTVFVSPDAYVLLLRRADDEPNFGGHWALPGGKVEDGETPEFGARREAAEEIGTDTPEGVIKLLDRRMTPTGMAFHTFAQPVPDKFVPKLNPEHTGYAWAPLNRLPAPLHPAVEATLKERIGAAADMAPEDWQGLRDGFLKWLAEEEAEPEHEIKNQDFKINGATDSAPALALDRESVREPDVDGRLRIKVAHISKAAVNPYFGHEIPDYESLGLDPDKKYYLLRDPEELRKAAPTFNNLPLLRDHVPVSADDHRPEDIVGALGSDATFNDPYLDNSMMIWAREGIDGITTGGKRELSCGYRYRADMTPGIFNGMRFDGVMRDIVGNHVALVQDGRAGADVVVGDSGGEIKMKISMTAVAARMATIGALRTYLKPRLAMDAKLDFGKVFDGVTGNKFATMRPVIAQRIGEQLKGKLAKDASIDDVGKVLELLDKHEVGGGDETVPPEANNEMAAAIEAVPPVTLPATDEHAPLKDFLKSKGMGEDDINAACATLPKKTGLDESPEEKEAREKKEAEEKAAKDAAADPDKKDDDDMKDEDKVSKQAMDAAIKSAVESVRKTERGIRDALVKVRPWVGELPMAFDSGTAVFRQALKMMNVTGHDTIHESALETVLTMQPKPGTKPTHEVLAQDTAATTEFNQRFPNAARIKAA